MERLEGVAHHGKCQVSISGRSSEVARACRTASHVSCVSKASSTCFGVGPLWGLAFASRDPAARRARIFARYTRV